jgi:exodeoxyribonuclease-5
MSTTTDNQGPKPNAEQAAAITSIMAWLQDPFAGSFFVLKGFAGTGKTFSVKHLLRDFKGRTVFTAPTNKATKVLRESLSAPGFSPECCTIYSLLKLRLEASGEVKVLKVNPEKTVDLSSCRLVIVDEASMLNKPVLECIKAAAAKYKTKFLFMGDAAQLPPVKELISPVWAMDCGKATLDTVMRHDNQILTTVTRIRKVVDHPAPTVKLLSDFEGGIGVWKLERPEFLRQIDNVAKIGLFSDQDMVKVIAWRNVTVDSYNLRIRNIIFNNPTQLWLPTDRAIFTEPANDDNDEVMATTDDEGEVQSVTLEEHPLYSEFTVFRIVVQLDTGKTVIARVLHPTCRALYDEKAARLADMARANSRLWKEFWTFKEAFHSLRHAYSITAHRAQGSTYESVFVDVQDILLNRNRQEAFRCLYVACSRPKFKLIMA